MISASDVRSLALSLDGASEAPHLDRTSFRAAKRIFATMTQDGTEAMVRLADPEQVGALLLDPSGTFFSYGAWTSKGGALGVRLAQVDPDQLRALLATAWAGVQPRARARRG